MATLAKFMRNINATPKLCRVTLVKSHQHATPDVRKSVIALGLSRVNQSIVHKNTSPIRGLIHTVMLQLYYFLPFDRPKDMF
jgi:ribosomal protein L30